MTNPIVTIEMENGDIMKAELYPEVAPNTVNNFVSLVKKGYYDGLIFHRVINGFMIQGGCPDGNGQGAGRTGGKVSLVCPAVDAGGDRRDAGTAYAFAGALWR